MCAKIAVPDSLILKCVKSDPELKPLNNQINILWLKLFCMKVYYFLSEGPSGLTYEFGGKGMSAYRITYLTIKNHCDFSEIL